MTEMKFTDFKIAVRRFPLFSTSQLGALGDDRRRIFPTQLTQWQKQGLLVRLRRNLYMLNEHDRTVTPSRLFLANQLYSPSYVSLEYALFFYGLIPERVADLTSVTTKKTQNFANALGTFRYQHVKKECFLGFVSQKDESGFPFFIATKEKALLDFLYLNIKSLDLDKEDFFSASLRLQNLKGLNLRKLTKMAGKFQNKKLKKIVRNLCVFAAKDGGR